jgi:hypothetical protein
MRKRGKKHISIPAICFSAVLTWLPAISVATEPETYDQSEVVYQQGAWAAVCSSSSVTSDTHCNIQYVGNDGTSWPRLFLGDGGSFTFLDRQPLVGLWRFNVGHGQSLEILCQGMCVLLGAEARKMHSALLTGRFLHIENVTLPDLHKAFTIEIGDYHTAFAAIERWHTAH